MTHLRKRQRKVHTARHIHIPITPELQKLYMFDAHGALAAMRLAPSRSAFLQLVNVINVVTVALADIGETSAILASGVRTLQQVGDRATASNGCYGLARHEVGPISNAVFECEVLIKKLDVMGLHLAGEKLQMIDFAARQQAAWFASEAS